MSHLKSKQLKKKLLFNPPIPLLGTYAENKKLGPQQIFV